MLLSNDPGPCIVCGKAHSACTAGNKGGPIAIVQLPGRDGATPPDDAPLRAELVQAGLSAGEFTSATYRGTKRK